MSIKIGILGYGNLGKGIEIGIKDNEDMELVAIFTRREPNSIKTYTGAKVLSVDEIENWKDKIDVMILCGGSATDLPIQSPKYAKLFNIIDSFDTHAKILEHFKNVDEASKEGKKVSLISCGWDPGAFSLNRLMAENFLPNGNTYTFWGKGVSQGHSDAIRRIKGVKNAVQYTVPIENAINKVRNGENPNLEIRQKHLRDCYVVLEDGADKNLIETEIKNMPNYFADYDTTVNFISEEELLRDHSKLPHGGFVVNSGLTNDSNKQIMEFSLKLDSNPEFTASNLIAYGRATYRMWKNGEKGSKNFSDVPPKYLSTMDYSDIIKEIL